MIHFKQMLLPATLLLAIACNTKAPKSDAYGNFEAEALIVGAEAAGRITALRVEEGQVLKAGEIVGAVDSTQLLLRRAQLQASIKAVAAKSPAIAAQLAVYDKQTAALVQQKTTLDREKRRVENLLKSDAATPKQLDDLNAQLEGLQKQMAVVEEQRTAANASLGVQKSGLLAEIQPLQEQIAQIDDQLAKCRIVNPVEGTVLVTYAEAGEMTAIAKPVYKIADLRKIILRAYVSGDQLANVKIGQTLKVLTDAPGGGYAERSGTVTWISPKAEFTPKVIQTKEERVNLVYAFKIVVDNADGALKIGMPAEVKF